jgi:hypothetical protein
MYTAIIGDLIDSRLIEANERHRIQEKIKYLLSEVNSKYCDHIASKFTLTLGDEFQGLLRVTCPSIDIIMYLIKELHPHGVRFGVGLGDIYTDIDPEKAIGADGPAYHRARECINYLKNWRQCRFPVMYATDNPDSMLINAICDSVSDLMDTWTDKQREAVWITEKFDGHQTLAAKELGVNKSSVTRHLKAANYKTYQNQLDLLKHYFSIQYDNCGEISPLDPAKEIKHDR